MAIGREDVPRRLYKYFVPDRVDCLESATLRYSPLCAFNDPFEGRPDISELTPADELLSALRAETSLQARSSYDELNDSQKAKISFDAYLTAFEKKLIGLQENLLSFYKDTSVEMKRRILASMDTQVGALCLTEESDNLLMWPHYAASHEGFVVEFDAHHDHFHSQRSPEDEFFRLRRVSYRGSRPNLDLKDLNGINLFLVKSNDWAYENEWRVLRPLAQADRRIETHPYPIDLFSFPRDAVKSVILGARVSPDTIATVREVLASHPEYAGVRLRQAVPDPTAFRLTLVDASR